MYCSYNTKLFKEFTSMKVKIKPEITDDWVISTGSYNKIGGFILSSEKLGQKVADIELRRFLQFCGTENLVIEGLKLKANFFLCNILIS